MSTVSRLIVLASAAALFAAPQDDRSLGESARAAIEQAVLKVEAQTTQAAQDRDFNRLFSFMRETGKGSVVQNGVVFLSPGQAREQVAQNMRGVRSIRYKWGRRSVTVVSPAVALLVSEGESIVETETGDSFTAPFAQTLVFTLEDGQWKILHAHQSSPRN